MASRRNLTGITFAICAHLAFWFAFVPISTVPSKENAPETMLLMVLAPRPVSKIFAVSDIKNGRPKSDNSVLKHRRNAILRIPVLEHVPSVIMVQDAVGDNSRVPASFNIEALKRSLGEIYVSDINKPARTVSNETIEEKLATGIAESHRPKCDNDYTPKIGSVKLIGLMKLPFLVRGAVTNTGCKW